MTKEYWFEQARTVPRWFMDHPWVALFADTLRHVKPDYYRDLESEHALIAWASVNAWLAFRFKEQYVSDGMDEKEADSLALSEFLPITTEDEMQYTDGDEDAAKEEAALELIDLLGKENQTPQED